MTRLDPIVLSENRRQREAWERDATGNTPLRNREIWLYSEWAGVDSNHRATDYESAALTAELPARMATTV
jgi:hypothetical protein